MSKNIKRNIIKTIEGKKVSIRPVWVFYLGSFISVAGLVIASAFTFISIHLFRFRLTHPGLGAARKINFIQTTLPWYIPVLAVVGLIAGYFILKRYDFSYRKNLGVIALIILFGLIISSVLLDKLGFNEMLTRRGFFRQIYGQEQNWGLMQVRGRHNR